MDLIGNYEEKPFRKEQQNRALIVREGRLKPSIRALIEVDVTRAREIIHEKKNEGIDVSFTGWLAKCVAEAVSRHKKLNSYRQGRKKIVVFDDVDIAMPIEREFEGDYTVIGCILRRTNEKSVREITDEIRRTQSEKIDGDVRMLGKDYSKTKKRLLNIPTFLKKLALRYLRNNGLKKKKHLGTVGITSIGTAGKCPGWSFPLGGITSTVIGVGGITKKPGVIDDEIKIREYLHLTIIVDHDLVDGGPLARAVDTITNLMESAYGLRDVQNAPKNPAVS